MMLEMKVHTKQGGGIIEFLHPEKKKKKVHLLISLDACRMFMETKQWM